MAGNKQVERLDARLQEANLWRSRTHQGIIRPSCGCWQCQRIAKITEQILGLKAGFTLNEIPKFDLP